MELQSRINWRVQDFCEAFGIGRTKFYALVKAGKIKTIKCGARTLIPANSAQTFQEAMEAGNV
jgi:excisionase family DNA binding protein